MKSGTRPSMLPGRGRSGGDGKRRAARRAMDGRLTAIAGEVSRQEFDRLFDEEQAKVDAIRVEIEDVAKNGRWPGHLYWGKLTPMCG